MRARAYKSENDILNGSKEDQARESADPTVKRPFGHRIYGAST